MMESMHHYGLESCFEYMVEIWVSYGKSDRCFFLCDLFFSDHPIAYWLSMIGKNCGEIRTWDLSQNWSAFRTLSECYLIARLGSENGKYNESIVKLKNDRFTFWHNIIETDQILHFDKMPQTCIYIFVCYCQRKVIILFLGEVNKVTVYLYDW